MVRIVSVSNLGYDDYGGHFSDPETDGVPYDPKEFPKVKTPPSPVKKVKPAIKLTGGRST